MHKLLSIQALRGIAVLSVVAFHALAVERKYAGGDLLLPDYLSLGQSGVDLFFIISGFIMVTVTQGRFARGGETVRFLWGRFTRIYPTYWFYFLLTAAVLLIKPNWVNASQGEYTQWLSSFLLFPDKNLPLVMVAWSLIHELWFYLVFAVLLRFQERLLLPFLVIWALIIVSVNAFTPVNDFSAGARIVFHSYSLEFIVGAMAAVVYFQQRILLLSSRQCFSIIALVLSVGLPVVYYFDILQQDNLLRTVTMSALFVSLLFSIIRLERLAKVSPPRSLQFVGDISYTVYLSHVLVLSAIGRIWLWISPLPDNLSDNVLVCLIMATAVLTYGWLGYRLIEQPILLASHRLRARWFDI